MTYTELLQQREWHQKCQEILDRDKFRCQDCGNVGFHNESGYLRLRSVAKFDELFPHWSFDGQTLSQYLDACSCFSYEVIDKFLYEVLSDSINDIVQNVRLKKLYGKKTKYYSNIREQFNFIIASDDVASLSFVHSVEGCRLFDKVAILDTEIKGSCIHIIKFDRPISKGTYLNIQGGNYYLQNKYLCSEYEIGLTLGAFYIHISLEANAMLYHGLNVHHSYYIRGKKPWEYPDDALVTLCEDCHKKRHTSARIPLYDSSNLLIKGLCPCEKCGGSGYLSQYRHVENGVCFKCGGEGISLDDVHSNIKAAM